jgi:hypothetical protein
MIVVHSLRLLSAGRRARKALGPVQPPRPGIGRAPFRLVQATSAGGLFRRTSHKSAWIPEATLGYAEKVRSQFLSLRQFKTANAANSRFYT